MQCDHRANVPPPIGVCCAQKVVRCLASSAVPTTGGARTDGRKDASVGCTIAQHTFNLEPVVMRGA